MTATDPRATLGLQGETLAGAALRRQGYAILATRYRTRRGEIDIVARDGATLVFVEVKTRASGARGTAREAVTAKKRQRLIAMATDYLARYHVTNAPVRFDVVAITTRPGEPPQIDILPGAFAADDR